MRSGPDRNLLGERRRGEAITLTGTAPHREFTFAGVTCTRQTATECEFEMPAADTQVEVTSSLEPVSLGVAISGQASEACEDVTASSGSGACAATYPYGHTVKVTIAAEASWELTALAGTGSAAGECSFTAAGGECEFAIEAASTIAATAEPEAGAAELSVGKGGNGEGTVESSPTGIDCGSTCQGVFGAGQTVTLTAKAAEPGSIFVAWSGNCTPTSLTECEVEVDNGGSFVSATFAAVPVITTEAPGANCEYGGTKIEYAGSIEYVCNGLVGEDGKGVEIGTATTAECPEGGITVQVEGEPSTKQAVCDGEMGADGEAGEKGERGQIGLGGPEGPAGATGPQGPAGPTGQSGPGGPQGAPGVPGPEGKRGKRGKAGKSAKVTCKVKQKKGGRKVKVTCTVRYKGGKASNSRLRWRLTTGRHVQRRGTTSLARLNRVLSHLRPGRYVLHAAGERTAIRVPFRRGHHDHHRA